VKSACHRIATHARPRPWRGVRMRSTDQMTTERPSQTAYFIELILRWQTRSVPHFRQRHWRLQGTPSTPLRLPTTWQKPECVRDRTDHSRLERPKKPFDDRLHALAVPRRPAVAATGWNNEYSDYSLRSIFPPTPWSETAPIRRMTAVVPRRRQIFAGGRHRLFTLTIC